MKTALLTLTVLLLGIALGHSETIRGEIFVVTQGGDNKRLGRVPVRIYTLDSITELLEKKRSAAEPLYAKLDARYQIEKHRAKSLDILDARYAAIFKESLDWLCARDYYRSSAYYLEDLPAPLAEAKTDSDGKYQIEVPGPGVYAIAAQTSRAIGGSKEIYSWLMRTEVKAGKPAEGTLSNDNLTSSGGSDSVIATCPPEIEGDNVQAGIKIAPAMIARLNDPAPSSAAPTQPAPVAGGDVAYYQKMAVEKFPALGEAFSELNSAFVSEVRRLKSEAPETFASANWPLWLAEKCDKAIRERAANR